MEVKKIVITGGPCGGKSTAMRLVQDAFTQKGYTVLLVSETATELISGGITPWACRTRAEYQTFQLKLQIEKEKIFDQAARTMGCDKVLIVCDRGTLDNKAYMGDSYFADAIQSMGFTEQELRENYDGVFHLVTAAKGPKECYTTANNTARTETVEEAAALDDKLIAAWTAHSYFRVIENGGSFGDKMNRLIEEIASFLEVKNNR